MTVGPAGGLLAIVYAEIRTNGTAFFHGGRKRAPTVGLREPADGGMLSGNCPRAVLEVGMQFVTLGCLMVALSAVPAPAGAINESLRATLLQMARDDQEAIRIAVADPTRPLNDAEMRQNNEIFTRNTGLIRQIVQEYGWPGRSLVGDDGASAAWLVVQHMDMDLDFQKQCLALMQEAFRRGEVRAHDLAYLTDRVRTHEGRPQMYGTQGSGVVSAEDEARVDRNRAAIGLEPWRVAVEKRKKDYANGYGGAKDP
jgi:hypothetical protein